MLITIREHINMLAHRGRLSKKVALAVLNQAPDSPNLDVLEDIKTQVILDIFSCIHMNAQRLMQETGIYPPAEMDEPVEFARLYKGVYACVDTVYALYMQSGYRLEALTDNELETIQDYYNSLRKEAARAERQASKRYTPYILKELARRGYDIPVEKTGKYMCAILPMLPWKEVLDGADIEKAVDRYLDTRTEKQLLSIQQFAD